MIHSITDASEDPCRVQVFQEYDGTEFPTAFFHIHFWKHKENGAPKKRKLIEFTMQSPNRIIISKEQIL